MRFICGILLAMLCLPCGSATAPVADIADLAGVPIRIFDLRADGVSEAFRRFMLSVPMSNDRRVPLALVDDTVASLSFLKAATPPGSPAYFVAAYIQKTPLVAMPETQRTRYLERYGEAVYPQQVCPVFISRSGGVAELLSVATNLPVVLFDRVPGDAESFNQLFALTEASHCGFIARELARPTVLPEALEAGDVRPILEALGDFEATAVTRAGVPETATADAADVLFAARLLASLLLERENPYTVVPGLVHEYQRIGIRQTHARFRQVRRSIGLARQTVRHALAPGRPMTADSLAVLQIALHRAQSEGRLQTGDPLADALIAALAPAIRLLAGDRSARVFPGEHDRGKPPRLITLAGANSH